MRKERLIVPLLVVLLLAWLTVQAVSSWLFEREMARTLADLEARGELDIERVDVERGWWASSGRIHLAPLFGQMWRLELTYHARHGVLSTDLDGEVMLRHGPDGRHLFGDSLASSPPLWEASYHTLSGTLEGGLQLAPLRITQQQRELAFEGGRLRFSGEQGNWRMRAQLEPWVLSDGEVRLRVGPAILNSQYAYTEGAHSFTQDDRLQIESVSWHQPQLKLDANGLRLANRTVLDDQELRTQLTLDLGEIHTAEQVLMKGLMELELSRFNADAIRSAMSRLRKLAASGQHDLESRELLAELEPYLLAILQDSPRLDLQRLDLESPMLGLTAQVDGSLFFDGRRIEALSLVELDRPAEKARWRQRLDGDFTWHELPTVVALWLGLPLDTRTLEIDVGRGQVRVNGRPLPPLWR
ncbi:DUF945 family protein [Billgrantia sp. LNSP4103-1]|uniref:DUF945 family protein n=1 Tax=Billgrantia sp. LNSP4103-1 TaxID=3410266 RepID=UPI00403F1BE3